MTEHSLILAGALLSLVASAVQIAASAPALWPGRKRPARGEPAGMEPQRETPKGRLGRYGVNLLALLGLLVVRWVVVGLLPRPSTTATAVQTDTVTLALALTAWLVIVLFNRPRQ